MSVEFGEWLPDLPPLNNPGVLDAKNVLPELTSYGPFPSLSVYSDALTARCQGAIAARDNEGNVYNFAGDATKLYNLSSATWNDASKSGGYTTPSEGNWNFTQWKNQILATNFEDPIQTYTMGTSTDFADLGGSPPKARHIAVVGDFVVVGNTFDGVDGSVPYRVRWSGIGNEASWTVSATTQADYQDLSGPNGWVMGIVGGKYGVVFQERALQRMDYVNTPLVFQFSEIEKSYGAIASGGIIPFGYRIAYISEYGFLVFDGQQSIPISENKITKTFFNDLDNAYLDRICGCMHPTKTILLWAYPGSGNSDGRPNKILAWNYAPTATKRWAYADGIDIEYLFCSLAEGITIDGADALYATIDDADDVSFDSRTFTGNTALVSAFNSSHKLAYFNGTAMNAQIETGEIQLAGTQRAVVTRLRPFAQGASSVMMSVGTRNELSEAVTYTSAVSPNTAGDCTFRAKGRYHRAKITTTGEFTSLQGLQIVSFHPAGVR